MRPYVLEPTILRAEVMRVTDGKSPTWAPRRNASTAWRYSGTCGRACPPPHGSRISTSDPC